MTFQHEIAELSARQYALFTTKQAVACGVTHRRLRRWRGEGRVTEEQRGVYGIAGAPDSWERRLMAACLAGGPGTVASHRAAARLWGLDDHGGDLVEITVPRLRSPRPRGTVVHRSTDLEDAHTTVRRRLPVTNPLRTIIDLGAVLRPEQVEDALDRGLSDRLFSVAAIEWMRNDLSRQGRHGTGVLGRILDQRALGDEVPDQLLEPRMARLLQSADLPPAIYHYVLRTPEGRFLAEVDFAYPQRRLAIEVDGYAVHGTPRAMAKDFVRQNGLVSYRWHVLRFTWRQVVRTPGAVAATIAAALSALVAA
jgi:hypothetical protein